MARAYLRLPKKTSRRQRRSARSHLLNTHSSHSNVKRWEVVRESDGAELKESGYLMLKLLKDGGKCFIEHRPWAGALLREKGKAAGEA